MILKFDPGASTLDAPTPPWGAQRPPGVELPSCLLAALADLCCRALDCRHMYMVLNGPQVAALRCFPPAFLFSHFFLFGNLVYNTLAEKRHFLFTITILFEHALTRQQYFFLFVQNLQNSQTLNAQTLSHHTPINRAVSRHDLSHRLVISRTNSY